jgi:hypothetical protein
MRRLINSKICKFSMFTGAIYSGLYFTGYSDDALYLLGGLVRGMRCGLAGSQIAYTYLYVK